MSAVCGFYLLGLLPHRPRSRRGQGRARAGWSVGALFLGLALFLAPALFGRPPQSLIWDRLIVGILPPDCRPSSAADVQIAGGRASRSAPLAEESRRPRPIPAKAEREEKKVHGVLWGMSFDQARELATAEKKPILIDFTGVNCANCRLMEQRVLPRPEVVALLKKFVTVQLYTDFVPIASITADQRKELAEKNQERMLELAQEATNPFYVVLSPDGEVLVARSAATTSPPVFVDFLTKALDKLPRT